MSFKEITVHLNAKNADILSDIFCDLNVLSVSLEDQFAGTNLEQAIFDEPETPSQGLWSHSTLKVLIAPQTNVLELVNQAMDILQQKFTYTITEIDDQDWVLASQKQFTTIKITDDFYIVPSWCNEDNYTGTIINLDPGLAFGTGSHPTTSMCLEWIAKNINSTHTVLDYGCGSGILAIAAKKFAAATVYGVDIDEQAIIASIQNATINNVIINFSLAQQLKDQKFSVVIANILSNPLKVLAPILVHYTKSKILLSGILESQAQEIIQLYSTWVHMHIAQIKDGWVLLEGDKINQ